LNIESYIDELAELDVSHVTMTVNAVDPEIGSNIYAWVRDSRVVRRGIDAAKLLLNRQLDAIRGLKARGILVKVNTIVIPRINDHHVAAVAEQMADLGVDIQNCMTMFPNRGTPFAHIPEPNSELMAEVRSRAENIIRQMKHCTRCRADAVGLLDNDLSSEFRGCLSKCSQTYGTRNESKPYVAVATLEGVLVNQHLGEADRFQIWGPSQVGHVLVEERKAPERGTGIKRWYALAEILNDCRAVLVSSVGEIPAQVLTEHDIMPVEMSGFIQAALRAVYEGGDTTVFKGRRQPCGKAAGCSGAGLGCG
jgi:nitrogen fixation protein NifB